jgi:hypothetical protein
MSKIKTTDGKAFVVVGNASSKTLPYWTVKLQDC